MAHWIIDFHGFAGTYYKCSNCRETYLDIFEDVGGEETCPNCGAPINEDENVYMRDGKVEG